LGGFNVMIITTLPLKEMNQIKNIFYIGNEGLFNFMACNVTIHKECAHGFIISKFCNDGLIY
jgi:hypothetical protein